MPRSDKLHADGVLACIALAALLATGCGFQARKEQASLLIKTPARLRQAGSARASIAYSVRQVIDLRSINVPGGGPVPENLRRQLQAGSQAQTTPAVPGAVNFSLGRAALLASGGPLVGDIPIAIYDRTSLFMRRLGRGAQRRPWVQLDFSRIDARRGPPASPPIGFSGLSPVALTDLLAGTLSGSARVVGQQDIAGTPTTHYRLNIDWDKAKSDQGREAAGLPKLSKKRSEALQRVYEQMGISDPIFPSEVWLDARGLPHKLTAAVKQTVEITEQNRKRHLHFETKIILELSDFSSPVSLDVPSKQQLIQVGGFGELFGELRTDDTPLRPAAPAAQAGGSPQPQAGGSPQRQAVPSAAPAYQGSPAR
jgi:hypothetical protein